MTTPQDVATLPPGFNLFVEEIAPTPDAPYNFWLQPSSNTLSFYDLTSSSWLPISGGGGGGGPTVSNNITSGTTAPATPADGDLWLDTNTNQWKRYTLLPAPGWTDVGGLFDQGTNYRAMWQGTQVQFDAVAAKDPNTLYYINGVLVHPPTP
jgi:hypothetical protein